MIVYLGMPRCASTWIYSHLFSDEKIKETHYFYTEPVNIKEYCQNHSVDFSTNNWSMDSSVVQSLDPYVSKYVLIFRNPIDLLYSYQWNPKEPILASSLIINKLLCYGDIVERWYSLVNPDKIIIENYNDIEENCSKFLLELANKLDISAPKVINTEKINAGVRKTVKISDKEYKILLDQIAKLETITNRKFNWTINNIL